MFDDPDTLTLTYSDPSDGAPPSRRGYMAEYQRERRAGARDIGKIPAVVNLDRRESCRYDLLRFLETYHGWTDQERETLPMKTLKTRTFWRAWSVHHLEMIQTLENVILSRGCYAVAIPRGWGKSAVLTLAMEWALLYAHRRYGVIVAATSPDAAKLLKKIDAHFTLNQRYMEDFPEVVYPVKKLEAVGQRAGMQISDGVMTNLTWSGSERVFPTIPGSPSSGARLTSRGITGAIRGLTTEGPNGETIRPDVILIDDPQTRKSAESKAECRKRLDIIHSDIMGLSTAGDDMAIFASVTVIRTDDVADMITDPAKSPQWISKRCPAILSWPAASAKPLWETYRALWISDMAAGDLYKKSATEFYRLNREVMDAGAEAAWADFHESDQLSAIQWAYDKRFEMADEGLFESEYQQKGADECSQELALKPEQILRRFAGPLYQVPDWAEFLTAGCDVNPKTRGITWLIAAWSKNMRCHILNFGAFPGGKSPLWTESENRGMTLQEAVNWGIQQTHRLLMEQTYTRADGTVFKVAGALYDAGHEYDAVRAACRIIGKSALPIRGRSEKMYRNPTQKEIDAGKTASYSGVARCDFEASVQTYMMHINTDRVHHHILRALCIPFGSAGAITAAGEPDTPAARVLAEELTSEHLQRLIADDKGRLYDWVKDPGKNNEYLDCLTYAFGGAFFLGGALISGHRYENAPAMDSGGIGNVAQTAPIPMEIVQPRTQKRRSGFIGKIF